MGKHLRARLAQRIVAWGGLLFLSICCQDAGAAERPIVFDVPQLLAEHTRLVRATQLALRNKQFAAAEAAAKKALETIDFDPRMHYSAARAQAQQGKIEEAMESLQRMFRLGVKNPERLRQDPLLAPLVGNAEFDELLATAGREPPDRVGWNWSTRPTEITQGRAEVSAENTQWASALGGFVTQFSVPEDPPTTIPVEGHGEIGKLIRDWHRAGSATGLWGVCYDNFDRGHSRLDTTPFPQLTRIIYSLPIRQRDFDRGLQNKFLFRGVAILGNSSTAITDPKIWRSQARFAYTQPQSLRMLVAHYTANHLYVYPEHRDHDVGHNGEGGGYGDLFPTNTPYLLVSQGSSFTDKPFLDALTCTIAAFRPTTQKFLLRHGVLAPTLQMILRRSYDGVDSDTEYLSGTAHPSVFDSGRLDVERMVRLAHRIDRGAEPPLVRLEVVEETPSRVGVDYFHTSSERLFDSPSAIARVYRTTAGSRRMVLSAEKSRDLNGRDLTFHWVVLRGDPEKVSIKPLNASSSRIELNVGWQSRRPVAPGSPLESNRIDIAAFVHNGAFFSAPAFVTHVCSDNERRRYDAAGRIQSMEYGAENYYDPLIEIPKGWRDDYEYDTEGRLLGWTRTRSSGERQQFTRHGAVVTARDELDRVSRARVVRYRTRQDERAGGVRLDYTFTDRVLNYSYQSPDDTIGQVSQGDRNGL